MIIKYISEILEMANLIKKYLLMLQLSRLLIGQHKKEVF